MINVVDDDDKIIPHVPEFRMFLDLVLLFLMIWHLVIDVCQESLIWRLDKHSVVKINWLIELNNDTLHI